MNEELKNAIKGSIEKWTKIADDLDKLIDFVLQTCTICDYYGDCDKCTFRRECENGCIVRFLALAQDEAKQTIDFLRRRLNE